MAELQKLSYKRDGTTLSRSFWANVSEKEAPELGDRVYPAECSIQEYFELIDIKEVGSPGYKDGAYICKNLKGRERFFHLDSVIKHPKYNAPSKHKKA